MPDPGWVVIHGVFLVCPTHGDIYVAEDADMAAVVDYKGLTRCYTDLPHPSPANVVFCPLCELEFNIEHGDRHFATEIPVQRDLYTHLPVVRSEVQPRPGDLDVQEVRPAGRAGGDGRSDDRPLEEGASEVVGRAEETAQEGEDFRVELTADGQRIVDEEKARKDNDRRRISAAASLGSLLQQAYDHKRVDLEDMAADFIEEWF